MTEEVTRVTKPGLSLDDYQGLVDGKKCRWCGSGLNPISHFDHDGGWDVDGFDKKQWLYAECSNRNCRYEWALWKLGVSR